MSPDGVVNCPGRQAQLPSSNSQLSTPEGWELGLDVCRWQAMLVASSRVVVIGVTAVVFVMGGTPLRAQGNGRVGPPATAPGQAKKAATARPSTSTPLTEPLTATRSQTFGTWLDTADVSAPGETWMWISSAYWRSQSLREIDAPTMGLSVGVAPRTQVGVSLPYYSLTDQFGFTWHGFGASYVTAKFAVTQNRRVNLSTSPTLEILSWSAPGRRRVNVVLPISAQTYAGRARFYGSTGYFSRGSAFGSGAVEWSAGNSVTLTATVAHSYSVVSDPVSDALGITRHRTDASSGVYLSLRPTVVLFASVGRTFAPVNATSGRLAISGGVTMNVAGGATNTPRTP